MLVNQTKNITKKLQYWLGLILWMVFIFWTSSLPGRYIVKILPYQDLVFHAVAYFILACLFLYSLTNTFKLNINKIILLTLVFCISYGIINELYQILIPFRSFSILDIFVNGIGSMVGIISYFILQKKDK